ncbi:MAG: hypothetical protein HYW88_01595, partial [Candidatus Sungbacteria bacterium]|nr:hypothetical protein [Candidatus Sungbacteria bacterium]
SSLVYVAGLPGAGLHEVVVFESGELGQVTALAPSAVEIMSFSRASVRVGTRVARTGRLLEIPVGEGLLGAIVDSLGHSVNALKPLRNVHEMRPIEVVPSGIQSRSRIKKTLETGVSMVDLMLPLGKGQRELVIGDQKTGKSRFLLRALLSQVKEGSVGVYAIIGKDQIVIKQIEQTLNEMGILDRVVLVVSNGDDASGMIYGTPYTAMTIAEYFRDMGRDVIIVLDDLTVHAKTYREISLLGKRFPGRNSYPGDIFYTHSRLLERAGNFLTARGEVAITCIPVVETIQGDMTGYIQTNVMSMTDGHIFFDHNLFNEGRRPAIDPFLSVTRVGRQTQSHLKREIGQMLTTFLRDVEKLHNLASFGAELGEHIKKALAKEERIRQFFDQTAYDRVPGPLQALLFGLVWSEVWRSASKLEIRGEMQKIIFQYEAKSDYRNRVEAYVQNCSSAELLLAHIDEFDTSLAKAVKDSK